MAFWPYNFAKMKHFLVLGSHPALSLAEARAVLGGPAPLIAGQAAVFDAGQWNGKRLMETLGGTVKLGDVIAELPYERLTPDVLAGLIEERKRGARILFGLTLEGGVPEERQTLRHLPIELKRELTRRGRSVRWVTGEEGSLSPAAVAKLDLTHDGYDFVIALMNGTAYVGLTTHVQDADAWSKRDYEKPFRDAKTGMLPPKLARMLVNLAGATNRKTVLDPFCGSGTVLAETALLRGTEGLIGSDIDGRQTAGAKQNLYWLIGDEARRIKWIVSSARELLRHLDEQSVDAIVTEGFLGKPLQGDESQEVLNTNLNQVEQVWSESFPVLAKLQPKDATLVACAPSYRTPHGSAALDLGRLAERFGYAQMHPLEGWQKRPKPLIYVRPDQFVARQVFVLKRI